MLKVRKTGLIFISFAGILGITASPVTSYGKDENSGKVLAVVGKQKITKADIFAKISMLPPQFRTRYETPEGQKKLLEQTVKFSLLSQEAKRIGIDKRADVAQKIKEITDNIIIQELTKQEISDKVTATDEDIKKYYQENEEEFIKPEKVKANLILFEVKEADKPEVKKAKEQKARNALKKLKKGSDFEELAKALSEDKRTKKRGGSTGFFSKGKRKNTYGEKFEEKAFSLKPGAMSDVFEAKNGYYIIKVADKKAQQKQTLDEVKSKIERRLKQNMQKEAYENYLEELEKKYPVKYIE